MWLISALETLALAGSYTLLAVSGISLPLYLIVFFTIIIAFAGLRVKAIIFRESMDLTKSTLAGAVPPVIVGSMFEFCTLILPNAMSVHGSTLIITGILWACALLISRHFISAFLQAKSRLVFSVFYLSSTFCVIMFAKAIFIHLDIA